MLCNFINKKGKKCKNTCLTGTKYCHLKSHHENKEYYNLVVLQLNQSFIDNTLDCDKFRIIDVEADGACAYRCMMMILYQYQNEINFNIDNEIKYLGNILGLIKDRKYIVNDVNDINNEEDLKLKSIKYEIEEYFRDKNNEFPNDNKNKVQTRYDREIEEYNLLEDEIEGILSAYLQEVLRKWIKKNKDIKVLNLGCNLENYTIMCHDLNNFNEYLNLYKIWSGEDNFVKTKTEKIYKSGKKKGQSIMKKMKIQERWGGSPEIYSFSQIFKFNINIYELKRFDKRKCKEINGTFTKTSSECRLKLVERFNMNNSLKTVNLMLYKHKHYMFLQEKS